MTWITANWAYIATILFGLSELLAAIPSVQSNSVLQLLVSTVEALVKPGSPAPATTTTPTATPPAA